MIALAILALIVVSFVLSLTVRRHGEHGGPQANWARTDEVFRDPSTDRVMRVWIEVDGTRHYVPET